MCLTLSVLLEAVGQSEFQTCPFVKYFNTVIVSAILFCVAKRGWGSVLHYVNVGMGFVISHVFIIEHVGSGIAGSVLPLLKYVSVLHRAQRLLLAIIQAAFFPQKCLFHIT